MSCEGDRNGPGIKDKIEDVVEIIQLINLVRAVIRQKSFNIALDGLCNANEDNQISPDKLRTEVEPFSSDDIATVLENAFGGMAQIIGSEGGDLGILLQNEGAPSPNALNMFNCELNDFVQNTQFDQVIEEGIVLAEENLIGEGLDPRTNLRPRTSEDNAQIDNNTQVLLYGRSASNYNSDIIDIINEVIAFNTEVAETDLLTEDGISKLDPNTLPDQELDETGAGVLDTNIRTLDTNIRTLDGNIISTSNNTIAGINPKNANKAISLKCGTIEDLANSLNFIKEKE
jgi:hypothetical protein